MTVAQIDDVVRLYGKFEEGPRSKIFDNADFGYTRVTIERPLRLRYQMTGDDKAHFRCLPVGHATTATPEERRLACGLDDAMLIMWGHDIERASARWRW
jgi:hypothetical protein